MAISKPLYLCDGARRPIIFFPFESRVYSNLSGCKRGPGVRGASKSVPVGPTFTPPHLGISPPPGIVTERSVPRNPPPYTRVADDKTKLCDGSLLKSH